MHEKLENTDLLRKEEEKEKEESREGEKGERKSLVPNSRDQFRNCGLWISGGLQDPFRESVSSKLLLSNIKTLFVFCTDGVSTRAQGQARNSLKRYMIPCSGWHDLATKFQSPAL